MTNFHHSQLLSAKNITSPIHSNSSKPLKALENCKQSSSRYTSLLPTSTSTQHDSSPLDVIVIIVNQVPSLSIGKCPCPFPLAYYVNGNWNPSTERHQTHHR